MILCGKGYEEKPSKRIRNGWSSLDLFSLENLYLFIMSRSIICVLRYKILMGLYTELYVGLDWAEQ